jgi:uncharacterized phiE125 gp8 family phage protein
VTWTPQTDLTVTGDGVFLTLADAKAYLRITTADEDDVIASLIEAAEAFLTSRIGRLITAAETAEKVSVGRNSRSFGMKNWPVSSSATLTIIDADDNDLSDSLDIDYAAGRVRASHILSPGTYTVTYTGGVSLSTSWTQYEPILAGAVRDLVAEWYANRDPGAGSVTDGDMSRVTAGGTTGISDGVPARVEGVIKLLRGW